MHWIEALAFLVTAGAVPAAIWSMNELTRPTGRVFSSQEVGE